MKHRIMIVEDTFELREDLALVLEDSGYTVIETASGEAALSAFDQEPPDLMICDMQLPNMDGLFLVKSIRNYQGNRRNTPVIFVSAYYDPELRRDAEALGIIKFIVKPIDYSELIKAIGQILQTATTVHRP